MMRLPELPEFIIENNIPYITSKGLAAYSGLPHETILATIFRIRTRFPTRCTEDIYKELGEDPSDGYLIGRTGCIWALNGKGLGIDITCYIAEAYDAKMREIRKSE